MLTQHAELRPDPAQALPCIIYKHEKTLRFGPRAADGFLCHSGKYAVPGGADFVRVLANVNDVFTGRTVRTVLPDVFTFLEDG